jgi:hypothetical protein
MDQFLTLVMSPNTRCRTAKSIATIATMIIIGSTITTLVRLPPAIPMPPRYGLLHDACNLSPNSHFRVTKSIATTTTTIMAIIGLDGQVYQCRDDSIRGDTYVASKEDRLCFSTCILSLMWSEIKSLCCKFPSLGEVRSPFHSSIFVFHVWNWESSGLVRDVRCFKAPTS